MTRLVHTEEAALVESTLWPVVSGSLEPGMRSSAVEHCFHTAGVAGSKPAASTTAPRRDVFVWESVPQNLRIPAASFFDLPRQVKNPTRCACGRVRSAEYGTSCQGCFKDRARWVFIERWERRFPTGPSAGEALARFVAPLLNSMTLAEAFTDLMGRSADVAAYRAVVDLCAGAGFIRARDVQASLRKKGGRGPGLRGIDARAFFALHRPPPPTIAQYRALKAPRYRNGAWYDNYTEWTEKDLLELWTLCHANAPLELAAARLARKPSAIAERARTAGLRLSLQWRLVLTVQKSVRVRAPRAMAYPYLPERKPEHSLLLKVNGFVPAGIPGREDACQALLLALLEGTITPDQLVGVQGVQNRKLFLRAMRRENFEMSGFAVGLDEPIRDEHGSDTGQTLLGII